MLDMMRALEEDNKFGSSYTQSFTSPHLFLFSKESQSQIFCLNLFNCFKKEISKGKAIAQKKFF